MGMTSVASWLSLGEGSTPLVHARRISESLGCELHLKCEGLNPTGSFKDRGMVVAVERAVQSGAKAVVCASTGNTAASAAAYAARAGVESVVLTPAGATAGPKRAQVRAVGARVIEVRGSFDDCAAPLPRARRARRLRRRQLAQPRSHRGTEVGRLRADRAARRRARHRRAAVRRRRQRLCRRCRALPRRAPRRGSSSARPPSVRPRGPPRSGSASPHMRSTSPSSSPPAESRSSRSPRTSCAPPGSVSRTKRARSASLRAQPGWRLSNFVLSQH